jgi:ribosome-binding protein aMBF1 (putative translation factor)
MDTLMLRGERFVVVPEAEYVDLLERAGGADTHLPDLPKPDADGNYPAADAIRVTIARRIITDRRAAGLSQAELARRAGIRPETLNRLEKAQRIPDVSTIRKIERAISAANKGRK